MWQRCMFKTRVSETLALTYYVMLGFILNFLYKKQAGGRVYSLSVGGDVRLCVTAVYFYVQILPGAALRSHYHLLSSSVVTVTCTSVVLSDLLFVLTPICSSVSPSVSLHRYFCLQ